jgi:hypothetical protein
MLLALSKTFGEFSVGDILDMSNIDGDNISVQIKSIQLPRKTLSIATVKAKVIGYKGEKARGITDTITLKIFGDTWLYTGSWNGRLWFPKMIP